MSGWTPLNALNPPPPHQCFEVWRSGVKENHNRFARWQSTIIGGREYWEWFDLTSGSRIKDVTHYRRPTRAPGAT